MSESNRSDVQASRLARAEQELARVQRRELARLCRVATALRLATPEALEGVWLDEYELRACLREELDFFERLEPSAHAGAAPCARLLAIPRRCLTADMASWPSATALACVSLLLAPHETGRLRLGQALEESGARVDAARVYRSALERGPSPRALRLLEEGLLRVARDCRGEAVRPCQP